MGKFKKDENWKKLSPQEQKELEQQTNMRNMHMTRGEFQDTMGQFSQSVQQALQQIENLASVANLAVTAVKEVLIDNGVLVNDDVEKKVIEIVENKQKEIAEQNKLVMEAQPKPEELEPSNGTKEEKPE